MKEKRSFNLIVMILDIQFANVWFFRKFPIIQPTDYAIIFV